VLFKYLFREKVWGYLLKQLLYAFVTFVLGTVCMGCCRLVHGNGVMAFVVQILICALLPNLCMVVLWHNSNEFSYYKNLIKSVLGRGENG
jgi:hypothetical protein